MTDQTAYQKAGVDTRAGDLAIELMRKDVLATHQGRVIGGVGGFAGLFDAGFLRDYRHPVLATSTDGVGTKVAIAQALDVHHTIGQDLVAMVIDDIVVAGATPLFLTDYIACGKVHPERIAAIVSGVAKACQDSGVAVVGGETAEHPGLLGEDEYDVAAAATGVVEKDAILGPHRVERGDQVIAVASSGLHSNGYSLARKIIADAGIALTDSMPGSDQRVGEVMLEPTVIYTPAVLRVLNEMPGVVHSASHITGGGIAQNLQRVIPQGTAVSIPRGSFAVPSVFRFLAEHGQLGLTDVEDTWNLGIGLALIVRAGAANEVTSLLQAAGHEAFVAGGVTEAPAGVVAEAAKGVRGGIVELVGSWD